MRKTFPNNFSAEMPLKSWVRFECSPLPVGMPQHTPKQSETVTTEGVCACVTHTQPEINRSACISKLHHTDQLLKEDLAGPGCFATGGTANGTIPRVQPAEQRPKTCEGHELEVKIF